MNSNVDVMMVTDVKEIDEILATLGEDLKSRKVSDPSPEKVAFEVSDEAEEILKSLKEETEKEELARVKREAYASQNSSGNVDVSSLEDAMKSASKVMYQDEDTPSPSINFSMNPTKPTSNKPSEKLKIIDQSIVAKILGSANNEMLLHLDSQAKKVGEKIVNAIYTVAGRNSKLSRYTQIALNVLDAKGTISVTDIEQAYLNADLGSGTAKAQAQQMMQALPVLNAADKVGKTLVKKEDGIKNFMDHVHV